MNRKNKEDLELYNQEARKTISAYKYVFGSEEGKLILDDLSRHCYYNFSTMSQGVEPTDLFFREGRRSIYLYIKQQIERQLV